MKLLLGIVLLSCCACSDRRNAWSEVAMEQTFVVDQANGPGTDFTDIAAAVAAVPDGALLQVRAGDYAGFTIAGKGLSVFCDSGVIGNGFVVSDTSAAQTVVVRGMQANAGSILLANCQGPVVIEHCSVLYQGLYASLPLDVYDCAQVHVADSALGGGYSPAVQASNSTLMLRGTTLRGANCLIATSSSLDLVDCVQQQVNPGSIIFGAPAMFLQGGSVRLVGGSVNVLYGPCITGMGTVRVDPTASLNPGTGFPVSTIPVTIAAMPSIVATDALLGGVVTTTMRGPLGEFGALLIGRHGALWSYPGIVDPILLDPDSDAVCGVTVFAAGTPLQVSYAVPNVPVLRGMRYGWQGISYGPASGLQASNPAITVLW